MYNFLRRGRPLEEPVGRLVFGQPGVIVRGLRPVIRRLAALVLGVLTIGHGLAISAHGDNTNSPVVEIFQKSSRQMETVFLRFIQERHLSLFKDPLRSEGYLCFSKPGRIRWQTEKPYGSIMVSDGAGVAQFEQHPQGWQKLQLGLESAMQRVVAQIAGVIEGRFTENHGEYAVTVSNTTAGAVLLLQPRNERMRKMMSGIEVHLAEHGQGANKVVLREKDGDRTEIQFLDQTTDLAFPAMTFDLNQPVAIEAVKAAAEQRQRKLHP